VSGPELATAAYWSWRPWMGVPVQTSLSAPKDWTGPPLESLKRLGPWGQREESDLAVFTPKYRESLERRHSVEKLRARMREISDAHGGERLVLLCFEPVHVKGCWCHRRVFADWWEEKTGEPVPELAGSSDPSTPLSERPSSRAFVERTRRPGLKLKYRGAGDYYAGSVEFVKDPSSGDRPDGWGYTSWLVYVHPRVSSDGEVDEKTGTLAEARALFA
jgi:hypothetical protein